MKQVDIADFERRYRDDPDPWQFATSAYEQRRYDVTISCLPLARYRRAFEPGCSVGELTRRLAQRCEHVVAWDGAPSVVAVADERLAGVAGVELAVGVVPGEWPEGRFDLVVLSEVGYYFDVATLALLRARAIGSLEPGGTLLAAHWLGVSPDHLLHGDQVHAALGAGADHDGLEHGGSFRDDGFRLDWWQRRRPGGTAAP